MQMRSESAESTAAPTGAAEGIVAIDILRGFALPGILLINIQYFSMPGSLRDLASVCCL